MDIRKVKKLIELLDESGIAEIEITEGDDSVRISRHSPHAPAAQAPVAYSAAPVAAPAPAATAETAAAAPAAAEPEEEGYAVTTPMVGTYYSAPNPDSAPFVSVGGAVGPETVVCIVEAMKIFNEIRAECAGTIERVHVKNGESIEFGQPLFSVRQA